MVADQKEKDASASPVGLAAIGLLTALVLGIFRVPWITEYFQYDVDSSWVFVLHEAFVRHWQFGEQLVWHYGPLGFIYANYYHPETYPILLGFWALLSLVFFSGVMTIIVRSHRQPNYIAIPIIAVIATMSYDAFFMAFPVMVFIYYFFLKPSLRSVLIWALLLASIIVAQIKISFLLLCLGNLAVLELYRVGVQRKFPWLLASFIVGYVGLWALWGQNIFYIPAYLEGALEHGKGFGTAMAWGKSSFVALVFYLGGAVSLVSIAAQVWVQEKRGHTIFPVVALLFSFFITLKVGFLNSNDMHIFEAVAMFIMVALLLRDLFFAGMPDMSRWVLIVYATAAATFMTLSFYGNTPKLEMEKLKIQGNVMLSERPSFFKKIGSFMDEKQSYHMAAMGRIRDTSPLPQVSGSVDLYNYQQSTVLAHGLDYHPRPVFQGYHTFSPALLRRNLESLKQDTAPEHIFFGMDVMMARYPTIDDGVSWPEIISRYDIAGIYSRFVHLQKIEHPRTFQLTPFETVRAIFGEVIPVPEREEAVWIQVKLTPTWLGTLANFLYRNVHAYMTFTTANDYTRSARIIPATAGEGFLLSPLIDNNYQFVRFVTEGANALPGMAIRSIQFDLEGGQYGWTHYLYEKEFEIVFSDYVFEWQEAPVPDWPGAHEISLTLTSHPTRSDVATLENVVDKHLELSTIQGYDIIQINGASRLLYPLEGHQTSVSSAFGIFNSFYFIKPASQGVQFFVKGIDQKKEETILWQGNTPPLALDETGINNEMNITFEADAYTGLIFETQPVDKDASNWSYWADIKIE